MLRLSSLKAAALALLSGAVSAILFFRADLFLIGVCLLKGVWSALPIVSVVFAAIWLYAICSESGAMRAIGEMARRFTGDELLRILLISCVISSFLQGITGYGVPIAVCAPLLLAIGVQPFWAVVLPPLGHAWGNTFGTLAMAWDTLISEAGISGSDEILRTAFCACVMIWLWNFLAMALICLFYGGRRALRHGLLAISVLSLVQGGGELLLASIDTTLACFLPSVLSLLLIVLLNRLPLYAGEWSVGNSPVISRQADVSRTGQAGTPDYGVSLFPYLFLTAVAVLVLLISPVKAYLSAFRIGIRVPGTATGYGYLSPGSDSYAPVSPLTHAAAFLLLTGLASLAFFSSRGLLGPGSLRKAGKLTVRKALPVSVSVILLLTLSKIMSDSGMAYVLAGGLATAFGRFYTPAAPAVGLVGSMLTGSNTASNILFTKIQTLCAQITGLDPVPILAAQTAGGAIGCAVSPTNLMLGASMVSASGQEGALLRKLLPPAIAGTLLTGILCILFSL